MSKSKDIVYFELSNWTQDEHYPAEEPFTTWIGNDLNIYFNNEDWVKRNNLCVVRNIIDMSVNFCITATKEWVDKHCPRLLTEHKKFLRYPEEDDVVYGDFGDRFLEYSADNIGIRENYDN